MTLFATSLLALAAFAGERIQPDGTFHTTPGGHNGGLQTEVSNGGKTMKIPSIGRTYHLTTHPVTGEQLYKIDPDSLGRYVRFQGGCPLYDWEVLLSDGVTPNGTTGQLVPDAYHCD
ncbi:hypothetical protein [Planctomycetes bacterium Poly30]|uniref:hypothetical protein n=1 Tax=Saltatorellus ferox TaxID=2528018 RepID=UPI0011A9FDE2